MDDPGRSLSVAGRVVAIQRSTHRIRQRDLNLRILPILQRHADTRERSACAHRAD